MNAVIISLNKVLLKSLKEAIKRKSISCQRRTTKEHAWKAFDLEILIFTSKSIIHP